MQLPASAMGEIPPAPLRCQRCGILPLLSSQPMGRGPPLTAIPCPHHPLLADVRKALKNSGSAASPLNGGNGAGMPFFLPPPYAIAHHLLKSWAERDGSWFAEAQTPALARI